MAVRLPLMAVAMALLAVGAAVAIVGPGAPSESPEPAATDVAQFGNETAFRDYVADAQRLSSSGLVGPAVRRGNVRFTGGDGAATREVTVEDDAAQATPQATQTPAPSADEPDRVGTTNVQVAGLDEPDIVKTDGTHFYYAPDRAVAHPRPADRRTEEATMPPERRPQTHVIDAGDPADPRAVAAIDADGRLLQTGDRLLVLGDDRLTGYDVSDPSNPEQVWTRSLDDPIVTARERNGTLYLVTRTPVGPDLPCPLTPIGEDAAVPCGDVFRPDGQVPVDATYSAFAMDASDGDVRDAVSFVGTGRGTVVYMSPDAVYVTYTERTSRAALLGDFLTDDFDATPERVERRIDEIRSYDISAESREREITRAARAWLESLEDPERERLEQRLSERFQAYVADRQRDLTRTGIVRIAVDETDLSVEATGTVPGRPLNQFSLDEHDDTVRIATTIPGRGDAESQNDLYVLDASSLSSVGEVTGMGAGQRVYAVRYVGDTAYVVTFRQVDPLHVVDLSEPSDPVERGTLKLPGFSTYLHPIDDGHVLGIGEEDGRVKTVLFDVSDPTDPTIADSTVHAARWSAVRQTHHAFTIDRRHGVFFLPTGGSGLVIDYRNGSLDRTHTVVTGGTPERARYVGDYLYVFAGSELAVVDETNWTRAATLELAAS